MARVYSRSELSQGEVDRGPEGDDARVVQAAEKVLLPRPEPGVPLWAEAAARLSESIDAKNYRTWFAPVEQLSYERDGRRALLRLLIPNDSFRWAFEHFREALNRALLMPGSAISWSLENASDYEPKD